MTESIWGDVEYSEGGVTIPWPEELEDNGVHIAELLKAVRGLGVTARMKINNVEGTAVIYTEHQRALYRRGLTFAADIEAMFVEQGSPVFPETVQPVQIWKLEGVTFEALSIASTPMKPAPTKNHSSLAQELHHMIPGIEDTVTSPCGCGLRFSIWRMVQHLNDAHHPGQEKNPDKWSRERIADWLDTLDADLVLDPDRKPPTRPPPLVADGGKFAEAMMEINVTLDQMYEGIEAAHQSLMKFTDQYLESVGEPMQGTAAGATWALANHQALKMQAAKENSLLIHKTLEEWGIKAGDLIQIPQASALEVKPGGSSKHHGCDCSSCKMYSNVYKEEP